MEGMSFCSNSSKPVSTTHNNSLLEVEAGNAFSSVYTYVMYTDTYLCMYVCMYMYIIGASLSKPHTSVTSLRRRVCMLACLLAWTDRLPEILNKRV